MGKKKDIVWVSAAPMGGYINKAFDADVFEEDQTEAIAIMKQNNAGVSLVADQFPKKMYGMYPDKHYKKLPDLCTAGGFWTVSAATAEVLQQFDLGDGGLYPVELFQHNRTKRIEGEYFCWNFGNVKKTYLPEESPDVKRPYPGRDFWKLRLAPKDGDVALSSEALNPPDAWIEHNFHRAFFLSDPLVQALRAAKVTRNFTLRKCRVIEQN